jgi:hypothetical protein
MGKNRLEAFSDGVFAIIITIMVLELKVPHSAGLAALLQLWPVFLSYVLSFVFLGIYWNNHHHMLNAVGRISGRNLWANLHLFSGFRSFFHHRLDGREPLTTGPWHGGVLLCAAGAYLLLQRSLIKAEGPDCLLARAVGGDWKGNLAFDYAAAMGWLCPLISCALHRGGGIGFSRPADRAKDRAGGAAADRRSLTNISRRWNFLQFGLCASDR